MKIQVKLSLYFNCAPRHEGVLGDWSYSSTHSCSRQRMEVSGRLHVPVAFTPTERAPADHWIGSWWAPEPVWMRW